jgi:hypothetical protein
MHPVISGGAHEQRWTGVPTPSLRSKEQGRVHGRTSAQPRLARLLFPLPLTPKSVGSEQQTVDGPSIWRSRWLAGDPHS